MDGLKRMFANNRAWAAEMTRRSPRFFQDLSELQEPEFLWIGCADSRVPANEIVGMRPGELFVHRNVANIVSHTDFNCLSVIQYAVEALKVRHIIVCGHYGCGGVIAAQKNKRLGLIDNWLRHVQDVQEKYRGVLSPITDEAERQDRLCELNVIEQAVNVCQTTVVQQAWRAGQDLTVHGWIYRLNDGLLHDLGLCVSSDEGLADYYNVTHGIDHWPVPRG
ncbi:MAG: carbonate dehydratase [Gemmataceae bacterium]|nr:carbonate dehydratase [Gemmataceae bacterium]